MIIDYENDCMIDHELSSSTDDGHESDDDVIGVHYRIVICS